MLCRFLWQKYKAREEKLGPHAEKKKGWAIGAVTRKARSPINTSWNEKYKWIREVFYLAVSY